MLGLILAVWSALAVVVLGGGLTIESASPDALCPPLEATREVVASRLGSVELEGTWRASYVLLHRSEGDFVLLRLMAPDGSERLTRKLPVRGGSCATLSQVIALVLERFFLRPDATAAAEPPPAVPSDVVTPPQSRPSPAAPSAPAAEPASATPPHVTARTESSPAQASEHWSLAGSLWATNTWLAPSLALGRPVGAYLLEVQAGFDLEDHQRAAGSGTVQTRRLPFAVRGSRTLMQSPEARGTLGVELLALLEAARTRGLSQNGQGTRVTPSIGLRLGAEFLPHERAMPFVTLTGHWLVRQLSSPLQVDAREVLRLPPLSLGVALGIRTNF